MKKETRGGRRDNAGRKPNNPEIGARVKTSITMRADQFRALNGKNKIKYIDAGMDIYPATIEELKGRFTPAELSAILDNMNGVLLAKEYQANASMLWAHLEDGDAYEDLFSKWDIDRTALREKILALSAAQAYVLQEEASLFWCGEEKTGLKNLEDFISKFEQIT